MSSFLPNIPQPTDNLDFSQGQLLTNNLALDTIFGTDHTKFSDATINVGHHTVINSIAQAGYPAANTYVQLFSYSPSVNVGAIDFTFQPSPATVATPITNLQSPSTAIVLAPTATTNVLNFAGLPRAIASLYAIDTGVPVLQSRAILWTGSTFLGLGAVSGFNFLASGSTLQIQNNNVVPYNNVYWTLQLLRVS
jgi:hypothetical protein